MIKKLLNIFRKEGFFNFLQRKYYTKIKPITGKTIKKIHINGKTIKIIVDPVNGFVDQSIYNFGVYEKEIIKKILPFIEKDFVVFDIGANIGQHSLIFSQFARKVIAFEPNKIIYDQFRESVKINNFKNIELYNYGIGSQKGVFDLYINPQNVGNSSVIPNEKFECEKIEIETLDTFLDQEQVDFVKIDVEGYELNVILGNKLFFEKFNPIIWMEYNPNLYTDNYKVQMLDDFINKNNYLIYSIKKNNHIENLTNHSLANDDIFLLRNH